MPDARPSPPLRYVVLRHEGVPEPHFDLMFETKPGGPLRTWRSAVWPLEDQTQLVELGEHRRAYLDYQGPISGGRGRVRRVAAGSFAWLTEGKLRTVVRLLEPESTWVIERGPTGRPVATRA